MRPSLISNQRARHELRRCLWALVGLEAPEYRNIVHGLDLTWIAYQLFFLRFSDQQQWPLGYQVVVK